jgi:hypothetical protein
MYYLTNEREDVFVVIVKSKRGEDHNKLSSLIKLQNIDYKLCVCEYGLRTDEYGERRENVFFRD